WASAERRSGRSADATESPDGFEDENGTEEDEGVPGEAPREEAGDPGGLHQDQDLRPGGRPGGLPGRGRQGLELLHQEVPVQPLEHRTRAPPGSRRGLEPHRRPAVRSLPVLRGRDEPEAARGRALGAALRALPGEAGAGPALSLMTDGPSLLAGPLAQGAL